MLKTWLKAFLKSFRWAGSGLFYALKTQRNMQVHLFASCLACCISLWLGMSNIEWMILLLTVSSVWVAEMFNTALETTLDYLAPEIHPQVKTAKDVAAGAVLIASIFAVLIGIGLWGPKLLMLQAK
jgi:undecaprenol kinase